LLNLYYFSILQPLLRAFKSLPPSSPAPLASPLAEIIHSLITIPFSPPLRFIWFGHSPSSSGRPSLSSLGGTKSPQPGNSDSSPPGPSKEKPGPMDRALSALAAGRRSLSRAPSPTASPVAPSNLDIVQRVHDLLDVSTSHYLPGAIDPDDHNVSEICKAEGESSLDDILAPLVMLMTRLALADDGAKVKIRELLLPADLDRTRSLESREDLLGRCLRLLASIHHARLKDAIGEMLFAICDSDGESPLIFAIT
jgi:Guanine nucleotide exchange factor synembryn